MSTTLIRRAAVATATATLMLGGSLAAAPAASAVSESPQGQVHRLEDGCFVGSYKDGGWATTTLYYKNRCKKTHRLKVSWRGAGSEVIKVRGKARGDTWSFHSNKPSIRDLGRA
jgi:hypothetical protein